MSSADEHRGINQEPQESGVNASAEEGRTVIKETYEDTRCVINTYCQQCWLTGLIPTNPLANHQNGHEGSDIWARS